MKLYIPNFIKKWLIRRAQRTPYFDLIHDGALYMERWWLRKPPGHGEHSSTYDKTKSGIGIRVHHTVRSDRGRDLHDHPWWNISIVLAGGYWEIVPMSQAQPAAWDEHCYRRIWRGPGSIVFRRAGHRHRLLVPKGDSAWSLFIMGPWKRDWGFHTREGWSYWRNYIGVAPGQDENTKPAKADVRVTAENRVTVTLDQIKVETLTAGLREAEERRPGITALAIRLARENRVWPYERVVAEAKVLYTSRRIAKKINGEWDVIDNPDYLGGRVDLDAAKDETFSLKP
ncbi:hypothetical protein AH2_00018 [Burkholderia phage vB_BceS_AH2]|uniref:Uncharacterized protein n=1 Tax=Burkholderia phage vB_BceS_AH2 TaxID=1133022 RepID=I6NP82_9CAUD|nr:cysteine dioxygenase [Burkholderia phage vB_BceS_AH2]AEY69528.1 hypothetical protein AH2_00018 [Burkholderia phage vB_BceS_AH2]